MEDWEPSDPQVDEAVQVRCVNPECWMYYDPEKENCPGETWHPRTFSEYQGVPPHGGIVEFHEDEAFDCAECGHEGEEINNDGR